MNSAQKQDMKHCQEGEGCSKAQEMSPDAHFAWITVLSKPRQGKSGDPHVSPGRKVIVLQAGQSQV